MIMMLREKRDIKPLLLKFGVAVALSFAGFLYSRIRTRWIRPSQPRYPSSHSSDYKNEVDSGGGKTVLKDDIHSSQTTPSSYHNASITAEKHQEETYIPKITVDHSLVGLSPSSKHSGDKVGYLLPEFNDLVKEFDFSATSAGISMRKDVETPRSDIETPKAFITSEKDDYEQEIKQLRNMVRILRERERNLEVQLLEYYGLKEQETAVMELQNRLKINNMEAKLFTLKIESLQAENRRLEAQVADYTKVTAELEAAKAKIKILKKKLRSEAEQNKEQILTLHKRVTKLQEQEQEQKAVASDPGVQLKLQMLKELQGEVEELRKSNSSLLLENSELARRLESTQILATSVLDSPEAEALQGMTHRMRQENEDLSKEIEQLQADRCTDVEELVYLRWINACLRYELRNFQPPPGKTVARELSKTLSPKSEEKAKQLILEYANTEGMGERGIRSMDFDSDQWSSSQASYLTDIGEFDDSPVDISADNRTKTSSKTKFFSKLRKLLRVKDSHQDDHVPSSDKTVSLEEMTGTYSCESPFCSSSVSTGIDASTGRPSNAFTPLSQISLGPSPDIQKLRSLNTEDIKALESISINSDVRSSIYYKQNILGGDGVMDSLQENRSEHDLDSVQKTELVKYAEVLRDSRGGTPRLHKKSKSCNFY